MSELYDQLRAFSGSEFFYPLKNPDFKVAATEGVKFLLETVPSGCLLLLMFLYFDAVFQREDTFLVLTYTHGVGQPDHVEIHDGDGHTYGKYTYTERPLPLEPDEQVTLFAKYDGSCWVVMLASEY